MTGLWLISYIALWILFLVVAVVLLSVLRNLGVIYESMVKTVKLSPPPTKLVAGEVLPELTLQTLAGDSTSLSEFPKKKTAFIIVSSHCSPCVSLLKRIAEDNTNPDPLDSTIRSRIIVSVGSIPESAELISRSRLPQDVPVLVDAENSLAKEWGITTTPTTIVVDDQFKVVRHIFGTG